MDHSSGRRRLHAIASAALGIAGALVLAGLGAHEALATGGNVTVSVAIGAGDHAAAVARRYAAQDAHGRPGSRPGPSHPPGTHRPGTRRPGPHPPRPPAIRSVTVSVATIKLKHCAQGPAKTLTFPDDTCTTTRVRVLDTGAAARILVSGTAAAPSDHGPQWTLCRGKGVPACSGPVASRHRLPGVNQFLQQTLFVPKHGKSAGSRIGTTPACDRAFGRRGCRAAAGQHGRRESLRLIGPASSTDTSTTFTTTITWTAT